MNLQVIDGCAGTDPGLPTAETDPGGRYIAVVTNRFLMNECKVMNQFNGILYLIIL